MLDWVKQARERNDVPQLMKMAVTIMDTAGKCRMNRKKNPENHITGSRGL